MRDLLIVSVKRLGCLAALLLGLAGLPALLPAATPIGALYGSQVACDPAVSGCIPIPLTGTLLCASGSGCPLRSAPSWTDSTRFWGTTGNAANLCRTSTDGGVTWANCASNPATITGNGFYAGASDGSVLATGTTGAGFCTIERSINNAASWSTVYTTATKRGCNGPASSSSLLKCLPTGGACVLVVFDASTGTYRTFATTDNGQTWDDTQVSGATTNRSQTALVFDGTLGIETILLSVADTSAWNTTTGVWSLSAAWGIIGDCFGALIFQGTAQGVCYISGETYRRVTSAGALVQNMTIPGVLQLIDTGAIALGYDASTIYVVSSLAPSGVGVWVSRNAGVSFSKIFSVLNGATMSAGDIYIANGCLYVSTVTNPNSIFFKVCA